MLGRFHLPAHLRADHVRGRPDTRVRRGDEQLFVRLKGGVHEHLYVVGDRLLALATPLHVLAVELLAFALLLAPHSLPLGRPTAIKAGNVRRRQHTLAGLQPLITIRSVDNRVGHPGSPIGMTTPFTRPLA